MAKKTKAQTRATGRIPVVCNLTEMAIALGLTMRRVQQLRDEGVLVLAETRNQLKFPESVQAYLQFKIAGVERQAQSSSADALRDRRAEEIAIKIAKQERDLIPLEEAVAAVDGMAGVFLESISGLPARMTRVPRERQRLEQICDEERLRLSDRFAERSTALRTGVDPSEADGEDNA